MQAPSFRVTTPLDGSLAENIDVLETLFPNLKENKAELTRKAFELAAQFLINQEFENLGKAQSNQDDDHEMMMAQFPGEE